MAEDPVFIKILSELLPDFIFKEDTPFEQHDAFVAAAFNAQAVYLERRSEDKGAELARFARFGVCIQALRILSAITPDSKAMDRLLTAHPFLLTLIQRFDEGTEVMELRAYANELISLEASEHKHQKAESLTSPLSQQARTLQGIKAILPSDRARLTALRRHLDDKITEDPEEMAVIAKKYWSSVWETRTKDPNLTTHYLKGYHKKFSDPVRWP